MSPASLASQPQEGDDSLNSRCPSKRVPLILFSPCIQILHQFKFADVSSFFVTSIVTLQSLLPHLLTQDEKLTPFILNACSSQLRQLYRYGNFRRKLHGIRVVLDCPIKGDQRVPGGDRLEGIEISQASSEATLNVGGLQHVVS